jgi:hypothetical protein
MIVIRLAEKLVEGLGFWDLVCHQWHGMLFANIQSEFVDSAWSIIVIVLSDAIETFVVHVVLFLLFVAPHVDTRGSRYRRTKSFAILGIAQGTGILGSDQNSCGTSCVNARYDRGTRLETHRI